MNEKKACLIFLDASIRAHSPDQIVCGSKFYRGEHGVHHHCHYGNLNYSFIYWSSACNPTSNLLSTRHKAPAPLHLFAGRVLA